MRVWRTSGGELLPPALAILDCLFISLVLIDLQIVEKLKSLRISRGLSTLR